MNVLKGVAVYRGIVFGKLKAYRKDYFDMYSDKVFSGNSEFEISLNVNSSFCIVFPLYIKIKALFSNFALNLKLL